jgi:hypothetical protein
MTAAIRHRILAGAAAVIRCCMAVQAQNAPFELPAPTGRHAVGTTVWHLTDSSRTDPFSSAGGARQVQVLAWYPAAPKPGAARAPYLREGLAEVRAFARGFGEETAYDHMAGVRTHAETDAAVVTTPEKLPVLVFSHGYTGIPSAYTALVEDLASHG